MPLVNGEPALQCAALRQGWKHVDETVTMLPQEGSFEASKSDVRGGSAAWVLPASGGLGAGRKNRSSGPSNSSQREDQKVGRFHIH